MPQPSKPILIDAVTRAFMDRHGTECAAVLILPWQRVWYAAWAALLLVGALVRWDVTFFIVSGGLALLYFGIILFRALIVGYTVAGHGEIRVTPEELRALRDEELPRYTILVPLYREANVTGKIIRHLGALDYPRHLLDIKLLLEPDDEETQGSVAAAVLGPEYHVIVVPDSHPKTKPKACNHGLLAAKGDLCVVFDAEDRPEPDQLKKVVCGFRRVDERVVCIQAKLNYYNRKQNLLTRWFTVEYSTNFDLFLPGLQHAGIPMPLGGTSNHFRTAALRACDGWDPFNVTEDCDLGVRIYRRGYRTAMIDSTTWEEANPHVWNWVRQRSRWVKGFFQTHLAHMRNPLQTLRELGPWGFFGFVMSVGASSFMLVLNPLFWLAGLFYAGMVAQALWQGHGLWEILRGPREPFADSWAWPLVFHGAQEDRLWSSLSVVFFIAAILLFLANFLFVGMHVLACVRRRYRDLIPCALFMPLYWVLISVGAWKGFLQLLTRPHYWEKTIHGLAQDDADAPGQPGSPDG